MNEIRVKDLMTRDVVVVSPEMSVGEAGARLARNGISAAPVVEADAVVGIISESDVVAALVPRPANDREGSVLGHLLAAGRRRSRERRRVAYVVRQAMSDVVFQIAPDATIWEAAALMERHHVKRLPVTTDEGKLVGIVSKADLVRAIARDDEAVRSDVVRALEALAGGPAGIHVDVAHFEVVLTGVVSDPRTIRAAGDLAAQVPGVVVVRNLIDLEREAVRLDMDEGRLERLDPWVPDHGSQAPATPA